MKKITLIIVAILFFNSAFSQDTSSEEIDIIQNLFGLEKKVIYEENINLNGVDANTFWSLYDEYEVSRKEIGKKRLKLLEQYTTKEGAVSNAQADVILGEAMNIRSSQDKLLMKYTKKVKKATSPLVASQFYQIENYIGDGVRFSILENIDFIQDKE